MNKRVKLTDSSLPTVLPQVPGNTHGDLEILEPVNSTGRIIVEHHRLDEGTGEEYAYRSVKEKDGSGTYDELKRDEIFEESTRIHRKRRLPPAERRQRVWNDYKSGRYTQAQLANRYDVSQQTISNDIAIMKKALNQD